MQPGGGYQPDPLAGTPYGMVNGIAPAFDRQELRGAIRGNILGMQSGPMVRPGDNQMINDSITGQTVPLAEMRDRVAMRGIDANNELFDQRDRAERNRVQQDLAARASRMPLGTPTAPAEGLPGMPTMTPSTQRALERNTERLMRSPQGAMLAMEQGQEAAKNAMRMQAASTAVPVRDPSTGEVKGYVTGTGASLPNMNAPRRVQRTVEVDGTMYNVYEDGSPASPIPGLPTAAPKQQFIDQYTGRIVEFDANIDTSGLPETQFKPVMRKGEVGGAKTDPAKPSGQTPAAPVKVTSAAEALKLQPGTVFITPDGKTKIR